MDKYPEFPSPLRVKSPTIREMASLIGCDAMDMFPSPLGVKSPTINVMRLDKDGSIMRFPSPLGVKSPTMYSKKKT